MYILIYIYTYIYIYIYIYIYTCIITIYFNELLQTKGVKKGAYNYNNCKMKSTINLLKRKMEK